MQHVLIGVAAERAATPAVAPVPRSIQRQCACGGATLGGGECAACRAKRLSLQAAGAPRSASSVAHDFGRIPVHSGLSDVLGPSLPVAPPGDAHEQEADRVADDVVRMGDADAHAARQQRHVSAATASPGGGEPLPQTVRAYFEPRFGHDFSQVRVHADARAVRMSRALRADAFTYGNEIYFNEGRFAPGSTAGNRLLAHELVHTVQQRGAIGRKIQRREVCDANGVCRSEPDATASSAATGSAAVVGPGALLLPPGDCTVIEHRLLQDEVDRACDRDTRCTQNDNCATLWEKIGFTSECIKARTIINARCFRGGNIGHVIALANAVAGLARCWAVYARECQQGPRVPVPVPAAEPEKKPVVDKSFMDRMAAITGLTGTALIIYLIVSEGSRLFPPRNLIPVP